MSYQVLSPTYLLQPFISINAAETSNCIISTETVACITATEISTKITLGETVAVLVLLV